jgi:hypothetical protein
MRKHPMPPLDQLLHTLQDYLKDHAVKLITGLVLMGIGWYFGRKRAHADWKKQEFLDRLNLSLNSIDNGTLKIRTLSEKRCEEVFLNSAAADAIQKVARLTTAADPILPIAAAENWFYLNSVLNDLSEQFAVGLLKRDLGGNVSTATYVIALTCESSGEMKTRKIRAMVVRKSLLTNLPAELPTLESPRHITRWETLQFLAAEFLRNPARFMEVELSVA